MTTPVLGLAAQLQPLDLSLDVMRRLADLNRWMADWRAADASLRQQVVSLNPHRRVNYGCQVALARFW